MSQKFNSRMLRQLAEELLDEIADGDEFPKEERADFVTSLVRQWITYDGNATLFLGEDQVYRILGKTPLGKPCVLPETALPGWIRCLVRDWKLSLDDLPDILDQLNRGQSAEVTNSDGIPLRLWVNPKEKSRGVEPLVKEAISPVRKRDYLKIAMVELERHLETAIDAEEMELLACSVAKQWRQYEGHAFVFIDPHQQLDFTLSEHGDRNCHVVSRRMTVDVEPTLTAFGFASEVVPEFIARINLCQEIEFRDNQGIPSVLWHDPKARRICVRAVGSSMPPIFCPKCNAVLKPWQEGERQQACSQCGFEVRWA